MRRETIYRIKNKGYEIMEPLKVNQTVNNKEILSKLLNSVAVKCDCRVKYNLENDAIVFSGDEIYKRHIVEETVRFFNHDG